ncbi:hypothetical protein NL108_013023 [Boleophthalmus pectinirostris]|nr:hypothetical protein NL108_013023 [Boleophthalmus pectinirostris]
MGFSPQRAVLLQLYSSPQEDPEVRICAYHQLLLCPDQDVYAMVRDTLKQESSSQVGSYVWSHLTSVLRSEDPFKQSLLQSLPDDIISREFEGEFLKLSSYSDHTLVSDLGITNVETSLVFSPKSFLPRSTSANLTVYMNGRACNLLQVDLRIKNVEAFFKHLFGPENAEAEFSQKPQEPKKTKRKQTEDRKRDEDTCSSGAERYLSKASSLFFTRSKEGTPRPQCWLSVKVFGNEVTVLSCEDVHSEVNQVSLSLAQLAIKLLKGNEVQLVHRSVVLSERLVLPSVSGLPLTLALNMSTLLSVRLRGSVHYRDSSHWALSGYVKPNAFVGVEARMGVDSALGLAAVQWDSVLRSALSVDGSVQLQEGQDFRLMLNTPVDMLDILSFRSDRHLNGNSLSH